MAQRVLERLDGELSETDDNGLPLVYSKLATVAVVGNEDGAPKVSADLFQALNGIGFSIPAGGVTYRVGEVMPGEDFKDLDEVPDQVAQTTGRLARNATHLARLLQDSPYGMGGQTTIGPARPGYPRPMTATLGREARRIKDRYQGDEERPLGGYLAVLGVYGGVTGALTVLAKAFNRPVPTLGLADTVLLSVATHKASRLLTKDAVLSPLRALFTEYEEPAGDGELMESVHGDGVRHAAGELITCPFCAAVWVATGLSAGFVLAPRLTRLVCTTLTAVAVSDGLQLAYDTAKRGAQ
jgi:hypothetical protein